MASIAELYMTPPLWDDQKAELTWEDCLKSALHLDAFNIDALQGLANLRVMRAKDDEAIELLSKVVAILKQKEEANDYTSMPNFQFKMQTARLLIELGCFKKAIRPLDICIKEDDSNGEAWYLLGYCQYNQGMLQNALECTNNAIECDNQDDIAFAAQELMDRLKEEPNIGDTTVSEDTNTNNMDDNTPFEMPTENVSEEDISDDDQDVVME